MTSKSGYVDARIESTQRRSTSGRSRVATTTVTCGGAGNNDETLNNAREVSSAPLTFGAPGGRSGAGWRFSYSGAS
jgi:hypothetical protein